jgi:hypothetical protein
MFKHPGYASFALLFAGPVAALIATACNGSSSSKDRSGFTEPSRNDEPARAGTPFTPSRVPCEGLDCKIIACGGDKKTTLKGKVYDPAGSSPLYNVIAYIPGGTRPDVLPPIEDSTKSAAGISCETCASVVVKPLRSALTNARGEFVLEDVPVDTDVPLVIQVGKWRRLFHIDVTKSCGENTITDRTLTLPKNGKEGDMPQIAVTSGGMDALECLLRGIGIDDQEFALGHSDSGHVHVFQGKGGLMGGPVDALWNSSSELRRFDMIMMSCEGSEHLENKGGVSSGARGSMAEYLNAGGKVFASHFHYVWFKNSPYEDLQKVATWEENLVTPPAGTNTYDVNQSFPKGAKLAEWLTYNGGSQTLGKIALENETRSVRSVKSPTAVSWIQSAADGHPLYFTFNTPIQAKPEEQCGRAVFTDLHVVDRASAKPQNISLCPFGAGGLDAQQKALEFLFFDLSACVQDDRETPHPPK